MSKAFSAAALTAIVAAAISTSSAFANDYQCVDARKKQNIQCDEYEFVTNIGCQVPSDVRCAAGFTAQEKRENIIFRKLSRPLVGELDPEYLGDSGMIVGVEAGGRLIGIWEMVESGYAVTSLYNLHRRGYVVGLPKRALGQVRDYNRIRTLKDLQKRVLNVPGDAFFLEILD